MRGNPLARLTFAAMAMAAFTLTAPAHAVDYSGDAHCFSGSASEYDDPQTRYANGTMSDPDQVAAVEELDSSMWSLRLTNQPFVLEREVFRNSRSIILEERSSTYGFLRTWSSIALERARERRARRTGSRYLLVRPEMKKLARERSEVRILKRKPCNPHILYLG